MGSVGEPRHGRPNATYVIYDTDTEKVTLREVEYNYQKTCAAIGEPTQLIEKYGADAVQQLWENSMHLQCLSVKMPAERGQLFLVSFFSF